MLVSEILRIKGNALFTTPPDAPVLDAVKVMAQHDIGSLVVMDHGRMAGMLTFAEVLKALVGARRHARRPRDRRDLRARPAHRDAAHRRDGAARTMLERHARYVPVMDGATLLGVVSFHDVAKAVSRSRASRTAC